MRALACSNFCVGRKPNVALAFFVILEICSAHCNFSLIVMPKYFADDTCFIDLVSM